MTLKDAWIKIPITKEIKDRAKTYAEQEVESQQYDSLFQTNNQLRDKYYGQIGQLLFDQYLTSKLVKHTMVNNTNGQSDNGVDFKVGRYNIDVKTAQSKRPIELINDNYRFFIPEQQLLDHEDTDFYVNIQLDQELNFGYITGIIFNYHVLDYPVKEYTNNINPAYNVPLNKLKPIDVWVKQLLDEQPNIKEIDIDEFTF